jgi:hypothetical protein
MKSLANAGTIGVATFFYPAETTSVRTNSPAAMAASVNLALPFKLRPRRLEKPEQIAGDGVPSGNILSPG